MNFREKLIALCKSGLLTNHVFTIVSKSESLDKNLMTCISSSYFGFDLLKLKYEEEHDPKKKWRRKKFVQRFYRWAHEFFTERNLGPWNEQCNVCLKGKRT